MRPLRLAWLLCWLALGALLAACDERYPPLPRLAQGDVILAFGDSLTYGTGAAREQSYPAVLAQLTGHPVVNAGMPGETTAEGLVRLPAVLAAHQPKLLLLCLGGNDMLRKVDPSATRSNLRGMIDLARSRGVAVVLIGVPEPRLFSGPPAFYADLAEAHGLPYEGEGFDEVLKTPALKSDPIHANAQGYRKVAERILAVLQTAGAL